MTALSALVTDETYSRLRDMIVANVLQTGQKLVDRDLAEILGVSRTPVREALGRLAMTGLIEQRARRGYYVCRFSAEQITDLYEFRKMLELHSVAMAVINATPEHISTFKSILKDLKKLTAKPEDHAKAVKLDMDIHKLIALAAGNKSLQEAMNNVLDKLMCFVAVEIADQNALATAYKEHKMLLGLIEQRDVKGAVNLMRSHIDNAQNNLVRVFQTRDEFKKSILSATLSTAEKAFATDRRVHLGDVR